MLRIGAVLALVACKETVVQQPGMLTWDVESIDFGEVPEGTVGTAVVTFTNEGQADLQLLSVAISEGDRDIWTVDWDRGAVLGGSETTELVVSFAPDEPDQQFGAVLQVRTSQNTLPSVFIPLMGLGATSIADDDEDGFTVADGDCDDDDDRRYPGAPERCNGRDDDCDGNVPANEADGDNDGQRVCEGDCDDADNTVYDGAEEVCDQVDNDCDGVIADDLDRDGDGLTICEHDCNDNDANVSPALAEVCGDQRDNDCEGTVDSLDQDADGHDACGLAPDCDDSDPAVFPRVVSPSGDDTAAGTWADPLATIAAAVASVQAACNTVYLQPGDHDGAVVTAGTSLVGRGTSPSDVALIGPGRVLDLSGGAYTLRNVSIEAGAIDEPGAGVRIVGGQLSLRDVDFVGNMGSDGAALAAIGAQITMSGSVLFDSNVATGSGGAVHVTDGVLITVGDVAFTGNDATLDGGAVHANGTVQLRGASFVDNSAGARGGAVNLDAGLGHVLERNTFIDNTAVDGGGIALNGVVSGLVRNNVLAVNDATNGGAVWIGSGAGRLTNNTLIDNTADLGAALYLESDEAAIVSNIAHFNAGDGAFWTSVSAPMASHNTVFGTAGADWVGAWSVLSDDNRSENPGLRNFSDDGNPDNDNLNLRPMSTSRDSGPTDPAFDDPDGTRNDRGHTGGPGAL